MTESELRAHVAKQLHRPDISEEIWQDLNEQGYVESALDPDLRNGFKELVTRAKVLYKRFGAGAGGKQPPGRTSSVVTPPKLQDHEQARAQAFSEFLGHHIATIPRVRRFRAALLGGHILSPGQAEAFLHSPALRVLSAGEFKELGIPLLGHQAHIVDEEEEQTTDGRAVYITLHIEWAAGTYEQRFRRDELEAYEVTHVKPVIFRGQPGIRMPEYLVWPMSVLGKLYEVGSWLADLYPWSPEDAAWFLLTDHVPYVAPMELGMQVMSHSDLKRYRITLSVEPWVSAETVLRAYRAVQRMVLGGRDNRPLRKRSLTLVRFIASQRVARDTPPTWNYLMDEWNQRYRQWAYRRVSNFAKDVNRAEQAVRFPRCDFHYKAAMEPGVTWRPSMLLHTEPLLHALPPTDFHALPPTKAEREPRTSKRRPYPH